MKRLLILFLCICSIRGVEYRRLTEDDQKKTAELDSFKQEHRPFSTSTSGFISEVKWAPDGSKIAYGSDDNTIRILDPRTLSVKIADLFFYPSSLSWAPDSLRLAYGRFNAPLVIYDTSKNIVTVVEDKELREKGFFSTSIDWASNDQYIALCGGGVGIVNPATHEATLWNDNDGNVTAVSCSPDSSLLALAVSKVAKLWNVQSQQYRCIFREHQSSLSSVGWSPDTEQLASGSADNTVRLWDVRTANCVSILEKHTGEVTSLQYHPGGTKLVSGSVDGSVLLWDFRNVSAAITLAKHTRAITSVSIHPSGVQLAYGTAAGYLCTVGVTDEVMHDINVPYQEDAQFEQKACENCCAIL